VNPAREPLLSASMRSLLVVAIAVVALAGCGGDTEDAERAVAECANAVHDDLELLDGQHVRTSDVGVEGEDADWRMTGRWEVADAGGGEFTCVVVPDEDDELRGLRVTEIEVWEARDQA
jgi:hypothetical protein